MRTRIGMALGAALGLCLLAPGASAKVYFPMRDHVFVVGTFVRVEVPGCDSIGGGCIKSYPGPVRIYLVRADVPMSAITGDTAEPPRPARALGRLSDRGRLRFAPHAAGRFRLVALATVGTGNDLRTIRAPVSGIFIVHPRGWQTAA
jgi:hypothetical protein